MRAAALTLALLLTPGTAGAQTPPVAWPPAWAPPGAAWPGAAIGDQHRWAMERLRLVAEDQAALTRRLDLETRLTVLALQAARAPARPDDAAATAPPPRAEDERAARATAARIGQIDAWLDRDPR